MGILSREATMVTGSNLVVNYADKLAWRRFLAETTTSGIVPSITIGAAQIKSL
jgi:hypothetical protein